MFKQRVEMLKRAKEIGGASKSPGPEKLVGHEKVPRKMYLQTNVEEMEEMGKYIDGQVPTQQLVVNRHLAKLTAKRGITVDANRYQHY